MNNAQLKAKILEEMIIEDNEAYQLAREIFNGNFSRLKDGVTVWTIYHRIVVLKDRKEGEDGG